MLTFQPNRNPMYTWIGECEERTSLAEPTIPVRINETIKTGIKLNFAYGISI